MAHPWAFINWWFFGKVSKKYFYYLTELTISGFILNKIMLYKMVKKARPLIDHNIGGDYHLKSVRAEPSCFPFRFPPFCPISAIPSVSPSLAGLPPLPSHLFFPFRHIPRPSWMSSPPPGKIFTVLMRSIRTVLLSTTVCLSVCLSVKCVHCDKTK